MCINIRPQIACLLSCGRAGKERKEKSRTIIFNAQEVIVGVKTKGGGAVMSALRACNAH